MYDDATAAAALAEIQRICLDLPEATERLSHGSPTFFVRGQKTFVTFLDDHHQDGRLAIWCAAPPGVQEQLVEQEPERFFRPPTSAVGAGSASASTSTRIGTRWPRSAPTHIATWRRSD